MGVVGDKRNRLQAFNHRMAAVFDGDIALPFHRRADVAVTHRHLGKATKHVQFGNGFGGLLDTRDNRLMLITGPNMAGKSTYMRQVALIVLLAQIGSFVPAVEASIGVVDKMFTRVGASDDLASGQSTFMLEMNEVAYILRNATKKSLIIYDEVGRGTSTFDGMSIARAIMEYTAGRKIGAKTLFATHYHELTSMEESYDGIVNYHIAAKKRGDSSTWASTSRARLMTSLGSPASLATSMP